jgi:hypothetical protein
MAVTPIPPTSALAHDQDTWLKQLIREGAQLPQPLAQPRIFQHTPQSGLMSEVTQDLHESVLNTATYQLPTGASKSLNPAKQQGS